MEADVDGVRRDGADDGIDEGSWPAGSTSVRPGRVGDDVSVRTGRVGDDVLVRTGRVGDDGPARTGRGEADGPVRRGGSVGWLAEDGDGSPSPAGSRRGRWGRPTDQASEGAETDPAERAREICLRQLAVRPRTRSELAGALKQRGIPADVAEEVLQRYGEVGIIDDTAFARAWVSSRHHGRGLAGRALANELRQKGVAPDAVGAALAELDPQTEAATARALVDRKLRTDRGGPPEARLRRLVGMLARKGYPPGLAVSVVRDALAAARDQSHDDDGLDDLGLDLAADQLETEAATADELETEAATDDHLKAADQPDVHASG